MKKLLSYPVFLFILLISCSFAEGDTIVEGSAFLETARPKSKIPPMHFDLQLEIRDKQYRITAKAIDGQWYNDEVVSSEGINNYLLTQTWPSWEARKSRQNYKEFGTVASGSFPVNSITLVQLAWGA